MARTAHVPSGGSPLLPTLVLALIREGMDRDDALRIASAVTTKVDNDRQNRGLEVRIARAGGSARSLERLLTFVTSATLALVAIPLLVQLGSNGYVGAAVAIAASLMLLSVVAMVRSRTVDATARHIERTAAARRSDGLPEHDLAQFATVVGRLSDRQGLNLVD